MNPVKNDRVDKIILSLYCRSQQSLHIPIHSSSSIVKECGEKMENGL